MSGSKLFEVRGTLSSNAKIASLIIGSAIFLAIWIVITEFQMVPKGILPSPLKILFSFKELHFEDALVRNALFSLRLNIYGYLEAVAITLPLGFVIGLFPVFRAMFNPYISASRFLPLTALVGVFIAWFGIQINMKVQFLAFSIFIYLLPVVIQRIDEVEEVYMQTAKTLGASKWQLIRSVFIPDVVSRVFDDIRVLAALSWTYIIVAELVNSSDGGIGALAYIAGRQTRIDKVFAILIVIMAIGLIQDRILIAMDKIIFPHKFAAKGVN